MFTKDPFWNEALSGMHSPGQMLTGHTTSQAGDGSDGPRQSLEKTGAGSGPGAVAAADSSIFLLDCHTWIFLRQGHAL